MPHRRPLVEPPLRSGPERGLPPRASRAAQRSPRRRARRDLGRLVRLLAAAVWVAAAGACAGPRLSPWPAVDPLAGLPEDTATSLEEARALLDEGDTLGALRILRQARDAHPDRVGIALALQDAQLEHLASGERLEPLESWLATHPERRDPDVERELWSWYLARSRETGDPLDRLLTARVEPDRPGALFQLDKLAAEYPEDPWARLGVAHARMLMGDFGEAQEALATALELDPSNARARRLEALVLARRGEQDLSVEALERWLRRTRSNPFVSEAERDGVRLDLAATLIEVGRAGQARRVLRGLIDDPRFDALSPALRSDAYLLRSAALADRGRYGDALADAERAAREVPTGLTAHEQRALLLEYRLDEPAAALEAWGEVERIADEDGGLRAYLFALRARVEQARLAGRAVGGRP